MRLDDSWTWCKLWYLIKYGTWYWWTKLGHKGKVQKFPTAQYLKFIQDFSEWYLMPLGPPKSYVVLVKDGSWDWWTKLGQKGNVYQFPTPQCSNFSRGYTNDSWYPLGLKKVTSLKGIGIIPGTEWFIWGRFSKEGKIRPQSWFGTNRPRDFDGPSCV